MCHKALSALDSWERTTGNGVYRSLAKMEDESSGERARIDVSRDYSIHWKAIPSTISSRNPHVSIISHRMPFLLSPEDVIHSFCILVLLCLIKDSSF